MSTYLAEHLLTASSGISLLRVDFIDFGMFGTMLFLLMIDCDFFFSLICFSTDVTFKLFIDNIERNRKYSLDTFFLNNSKLPSKNQKIKNLKKKQSQLAREWKSSKTWKKFTLYVSKIFYYKSALTTILVKITHYLLDSTQFVKLGVHASNHVKWNPYSYFTSLLSLLKQIVKSKKQTCYSITREILQTSSLIQWRKIIFLQNI